MTLYNDLYVRDALGDNGTVPYAGNVIWQTPDILPNGINPVTDPQTFFSGNYGAQWTTSNISFGVYNYIYVRVKNLSSAATFGQVGLYYVPSNIFSSPRQWVNNQVPNINGTLLGALGSRQNPIPPSGIGVVTTPFYWNPPSQPSGYHYCLLAQIITTAHPNPIPVLDDLFNFDTWIRSNGGAAFRNITVIADQPGIAQQWLIDCANPDANAQLYVVVAQCTNVPVGSTISMVCPSPGPQPPINYSESISNAQSQYVTTSATLTPNFQAELIVTYVPSGPAPQAQILVSYYLTATADLLPRIGEGQFTTTPKELGVDAKRLGLEQDTVLVLLGDYSFITNPDM